MLPNINNQVERQFQFFIKNNFYYFQNIWASYQICKINNFIIIHQLIVCEITYILQKCSFSQFVFIKLTNIKLFCFNNKIEKMKSVCSLYSKKSTSKQICIGVSLVMIITITLISVTLLIQYINIRQEQEILPKKFFNAYDKQSLLNIAEANRNLILDVLDFRRNFINVVKTNLINNQIKMREKKSKSRIIIPKNQTIQCIFANRSISIFTCNMDLQTDLLLKGLNVFQLNRPIKRYNIYYQNNANQNDIMLKSLSHNKIYSINTSDVTERIQNINDDTFMFTEFYKDYYQNYQNQSVSYRGKITFQNYTILLQQQGFGTFLKRSITRNLYSQQVNAMVLYPDISAPQGYKVISQFKPLSKQINYTQLLTPGYHQTILKNQQIISSFTQPFSSKYKLSTIIDKKQMKNKGDYLLIIHSPCMNQNMEQSIMTFIRMLLEKLIWFLAIGFVILICLAMSMTYHVTKIIKISLQTLKTNVTMYLNKFQSPLLVMKFMIEFHCRFYMFNYISKTIYQIIKTIQQKKRKYKKKQSIQKKFDQLPLNQLCISFQRQYHLQDLQKMNQIRMNLQQTGEG